MKKSLILGISASVLALATSCVSNMPDSYNINPKSATSALASGFIANAERTLARTMVSANVNLNPLRYYVQYWSPTDYPTESRYDLLTRNIPNAFWNALYRDCIRDLREAKTTIPNDITIPDANKNNAQQAAEVLEIYAWATLVETFGNIPYTEAINTTISQPKYDDQATVYADLIARLDVAIGKFNTSASTGLGSNDLINGGSTALWIKFANAMKLRMALVIADVDAAKAKTMAEATVGKLPASAADAIDLTFDGTQPNTNPLYEDLVTTGRTDFAGANSFVNALLGVTSPATGIPVTGVVDPRLKYYFDPANAATLPANTYAGGTQGTLNSKTLYSLPGSKLRSQTLPGVLFSYAQVQLMQAEAASRGFSMGGTAASFYNAGVTASIQEWGGSTSDATTYLAAAPYNTPGLTSKQVIGYQYWVALYNQPVEAWTQWRRMDTPVLPLASQAVTPVIPVRFTYPVVEQNLNGDNYKAAATAIGGDVVGTKLFWDK
jgi:hypothetical protein